MGNFLTSRIMTDIFAGVTTGVLYAIVALSLVIIWQSTHVLNFAQGAMAMFAAYIGMTRTEHGMNYWLAVLISLAVGFAIGGLAERVLIRPLYGKPEINPIVVMVGFLGLLEVLASAIWTSNTTIIPAPFSTVNFEYHGKIILLSPYVIYQVFAAVAIMLIVAAIFRFTKLGLQLRAAARAPEVARLLGVRVGRMLTLGWMISCAVGTFAAVIVASGAAGQTGLTPQCMDGIFIGGFIAAAIGGLESPVGAVIGGLIVGFVEQFVLDYWSVNLAALSGVIVLIVVLMIRPQGLFTRHKERRV